MKNLQKHLATIAKSKATASRPVLQHINYNADSQSIIACDSHRLLEFNSKETIETTFNLHWQSMQLLDSSIKYPDIQRLKPAANTVAKININSIDKTVETLLKAYKKEVVKVTVSEKQLTIETTSGQSVTTLELLETVERTEVIHFQAAYLLDLFTMIIDYKKECSIDCLNFGITSSIRPAFFEPDNKQFYYLITPVRMK